MDYQKAARRYAKTLFASSVQKEVLEEVVNDMETLSAVHSNTKELGEFLKNPLLTDTQVNRVVDACFENKFNGLTVSFIRFLKKKSRLNLLAFIPELFIALYEKDHNILRVSIVSAIQLSSSQLERLEAKLKQAYNASSFVINNTIDPAVIAGFQIKIGDTVIDANLKNNLHRLKRKLAV